MLVNYWSQHCLLVSLFNLLFYVLLTWLLDDLRINVLCAGNHRLRLTRTLRRRLDREWEGVEINRSNFRSPPTTTTMTSRRRQRTCSASRNHRRTLWSSRRPPLRLAATPALRRPVSSQVIAFCTSSAPPPPGLALGATRSVVVLHRRAWVNLADRPRTTPAKARWSRR